MRFPSIRAVAAALRLANATIDPAPRVSTGDPESVDVRLQVYPDGDWAIRVGSADYDTDHRGYWGASSLDGRRFNSRDVARDLINQARDDYAQSV